MSRLDSVQRHILMLALIIQSEVFGGTGDDAKKALYKELVVESCWSPWRSTEWPQAHG